MMLIHFDFLSQFGRHCYHKVAYSSFILILPFSNILNHKEVSSHVPEYLQIQTVPIVSYYYTNTILPKLLITKEALQEFNVEEYLQIHTGAIVVVIAW